MEGTAWERPRNRRKCRAMREVKNHETEAEEVGGVRPQRPGNHDGVGLYLKRRINY